MNDNDINWLAFRYVSGEMSDAELATFEQSLAESQPAREAVAAAVLLAQAVTLAQDTAGLQRELVTASPALGRATWRWRLAWALVGAAASLLFVWGLQIWRDSRVPQNAVAQNRPAAAENLSALALQWTAAGDYDFDVADNVNSDRRDSDDSSDAGRAIFAAAELFEDVTAPDWLVAAVSSEQHSPMAPPTQNPDG